MKVAGSRKGLLGSLAASPGYQSERSIEPDVGNRRTLWLVGNTPDVEPRTVGATRRQRGLAGMGESKECSLVEVATPAGNLGEGVDGRRKRGRCGQQRFKINHDGREKRWYPGLDAGERA